MIENVPTPRKIAYHTGEYPRATDTFIQREVAGIRAAGGEVITCSVRQTSSDHHVGEEQRAEFENTFFVQAAAKNPIGLLKAHISLLSKKPKQFFSALALAIKTSPPGIKNFFYQLFYFLEAGVLAKHLLTEEVEHLHNHFANSSCSVAMLASVLSDIPYSITMHGPAIFFEPEKWRIDEKIKRATFVSCISHFCRSQAMIYAHPDYWSKLHIVHCGVQPARYADRTSGSSDTAPKLLFVGRLAAVKGLPMLFDAVTNLSAEYPDLKLTIVGDGGDRAMLEARVRDLGIERHVDFVGYKSQSEVAAILGDTDIFVLPSFAEGVPVVLMEAMAARVPVIATRIAGVGELVEDGAVGFTVPPGDVSALTARIKDLADDQTRRRLMGDAGREKVIAEYDVDKESSWLYGIMKSYHAGEAPGLRP